MRRITALAMALIMLFAATLTAAAEAVDQNKTIELVHINGNEMGANVQYGVDEGYVLSIPEEISISDNGSDTPVTLSVNSVCLARAQTLSVSVSSSNYSGGWRVIHQQESNCSVEYTVKNESNTVVYGNDDSVLSYVVNTESTDSKSVVLNLAKAGDPPMAGYYRDVLTFTASVA